MFDRIALAPSTRALPLAPRAVPAARSLPPLNQLFLTLVRAVGNGNSCELFELEGRLDQEILRRAIGCALRRHPVLNSTLEKSWFRPSWRPAPRELPVDVRIHKLESDEDDVVHSTLVGNVWDPDRRFRHEYERPIRFHVVETPTRTWLQVVTSRLYGDGRSGYRLAGDIAEAYSAVESGRAFDDTPVDVADRSSEALYTARLSFFRRVVLFLAALWAIVKDAILPDVGLAVKHVPRGKTDVGRLDLGTDVMARLKTRSKELGTTVHALLSVALCRARERFNVARGKGGRTMRVLDLFSLRAFASQKIDGLYDSHVVPYALRLKPGRSDDELLADTGRELGKLKAGAVLRELYRTHIYAALAKLMPAKLGTELVSRLVAKSNLMLSNPGPVTAPIESLGSVGVKDFYNFSQLFPPARVFFIMSTFRSHLRLVALWDRATFPQGIRSDLVDPFIEEIHKICA